MYCAHKDLQNTAKTTRRRNHGGFRIGVILSRQTGSADLTRIMKVEHPDTAAWLAIHLFSPTRKEEKRFVMSGERGNNTNFHDQSCVISCRWCTKAGPCNNYVVVSFFLPGDWYGKMTPLFIKKRICWAPSFPPKEGLSDNKHECKSKMAKLN